MPVLIIRVGPKTCKLDFKQRIQTKDEILKAVKKAVSDKQIAQRFANESCQLYCRSDEDWLEAGDSINITEAPFLALGWSNLSPSDDQSWYDPYRNVSDEENPTRRISPQREVHQDESDDFCQQDEENEEGSTEPPPKKARRKQEQPYNVEDFTEPVWSKFLLMEMTEGRMCLPCNQALAREEIAFHLLFMFEWKPPQGVYKDYSRFILNKRQELSHLRDVSEQYWLGLSTKLSAIARRQRMLLEERKKKVQNLQPLIRPPDGAAQIFKDLEDLRGEPTLPVARAKQLLKSTLRLRLTFHYKDYADMLQKEKYLKNDKFMRIEIDIQLERFKSSEERSKNYNEMMRKLKRLNQVGDTEITEVENLKLLNKLQENLKKGRQSTTQAFFFQEMAGRKTIAYNKANAVPFTVEVFTESSKIKYAVLMGNKEVVGRFKVESSQEVAEIYVGAYIVFRQETNNPALDYFTEFMKFALLEKEVERTTRKPKTMLIDFITKKYNIL